MYMYAYTVYEIPVCEQIHVCLVVHLCVCYRLLCMNIIETTYKLMPISPSPSPYTSTLLLFLFLFSGAAQEDSAAAVQGRTFKMAVWLTVYYDFFDKNVRHLCM